MCRSKTTVLSWFYLPVLLLVVRYKETQTPAKRSKRLYLNDRLYIYARLYPYPRLYLYARSYLYALKLSF